MSLGHLLELELLCLCGLPHGALQLPLPPVDLLGLDGDLLAPLDHLDLHVLLLDPLLGLGSLELIRQLSLSFLQNVSLFEKLLRNSNRTFV